MSTTTGSCLVPRVICKPRGGFPVPVSKQWPSNSRCSSSNSEFTLLSIFSSCEILNTDYNFNCKTAILYLNTCDGGTEFKINSKIKFTKAEQNKSSNILHRIIYSSSSKKSFKRWGEYRFCLY